MGGNQIHEIKARLVIFLLLVFINHVFAQCKSIAICTAQSTTFPQSQVFNANATLTRRTNQDDVAGLQTIIGSFPQLQAWRGDPCLPNNMAWKWVECNEDDPPRITSLNLNGYRLKGSIPNFSQMQALEIINMDHNNLTGKIPSFLGNLPNLKLLNLSYNNLDYEVPSTLFNSSTGQALTSSPSDYNSYPYTDASKMYALNALWSLLVLVFIGFGIWWCYYRYVLHAVVVQQENNHVMVEQSEHVTETILVHPVPNPVTVVGQPMYGHATMVEYVEHTTTQPGHNPVVVGYVEHTTISMV